MPVQSTSPTHYSSGIDHSYELHENYTQDSLPAFQFRKRVGDINWRKLSSIDVDRVARELDFATLQENISTVTFCNIDAVSDVDPLIAKLFKLAQFTIEYLLHSQEYLQSVVSEYERKLEDAGSEKQALMQQITNMQEEVEKVKQENKRRRKMIQQQQMLIEAGASSYYQCPHCEKAFMNASFLQGHMQRRHPGSVNYIGDVIAHSQREQNKLGNQIKQLESELKKERDDFNTMLIKVEDDKKKWTEQSKMEMDEWKAREEERWKDEVDAMRKSFIHDIDKLQSKEENYQKTITNLKQTMDVRHSNLGELVDDLQEEKEKLRRYEERVSSLERVNNQKIDRLSTAMKKLSSDAAVQEEQRHMLEEQDRKLQELKSQLKRSATAEHVQKKIAKVEKVIPPKATTPKDFFISEEDESETLTETSGDGENREEEKRLMLPQIRQHLSTLLDEKLKSCGIDPDADGISSAALTRKLMVLKTERQQRSKQIAGYYQSREKLRRKMEDEVRKRAPSPGKPRKKARPSHTNRREEHIIPKTVARSPSSVPGPSSKKVKKSPPPRKTSRAAVTSQRSEEEDVDRDTFLPPSPRVAQPSAGVKRESPKPSPRRKEEDVSPWDTEESDEDVGGGIFSSDDDRGGIERAPGPGVKALRKTLTEKMGNRGRPPVGAVDVTPKQNSKVEDFHLSDDDDSFLVSSMDEDNGHPSPATRPTSSRAPPTAALRKSAASNSSNTYGTSVWGSGQKDLKRNRVDDVSSDDLELEDLLT